MLKECQMTRRSQQNISGVSQQNSAAAFSYTSEVDGQWFKKMWLRGFIKDASDATRLIRTEY